MTAGGSTVERKSLLDIFVGIQTGVIGGAVMLGWFALITPIVGQPAWLIPNLLGSQLIHDRPVLLGPGLPTYAGAALQLCFAGLVGALNGLLTPGGRLFGLAVAGAWYLLCYLFFWKRAAPLMLSYPSQPIIAVGYFLYGSVLGWHPHLMIRARS